MQYSDALEFIHSIARFGSKPGLRRVTMLLERMGNPQDKLKFIHVAGTNGKGSTSTMLSHIFAKSGYKTGLYISPFVIDFRERIQLNNEMISERDLIDSTALVKAHWDALDAIGETPTEFEVVVAIAMDYFLKKECDIVILEVGMGGRFDATNVIKKPVCSVITSIGLDHTEYLGETISEIALTKCGIIKPDGITVCYSPQLPEVMEIIAKVCEENRNKLLTGGDAEVLSMDISGSRVKYDGLELKIPLLGAHQVSNAAVVVEAVKAARLSGFKISDGDITAGIAGTVFPSRLEILSENPQLVLLDGAHNNSGAAALEAAIKMLGGRRIHAVAGFSSDKDVDGILKLILPHCHSFTAFQSENHRSMPCLKILSFAQKYCGSTYIAGTAEAAVIQPLARCSGDDIVLIFGSLYLAAEVRPVAQVILKRFADRHNV